VLDGALILIASPKETGVLSPTTEPAWQNRTVLQNSTFGCRVMLAKFEREMIDIGVWPFFLPS